MITAAALLACSIQPVVVPDCHSMQWLTLCVDAHHSPAQLVVLDREPLPIKDKVLFCARGEMVDVAWQESKPAGNRYMAMPIHGTRLLPCLTGRDAVRVLPRRKRP